MDAAAGAQAGGSSSNRDGASRGQTASKSASIATHKMYHGHGMPGYPSHMSPPEYSIPHMYPPYAAPYPAMMYPPAGMWGAMAPGAGTGVYNLHTSKCVVGPANKGPRPSRPIAGAPHGIPPPYAPYYPGAAMHPYAMMGYGAPAFPRGGPRGPPPHGRPRSKGPPSTPPARSSAPPPARTWQPNPPTLRPSSSAGGSSGSRGHSEGALSPCAQRPSDVGQGSGRHSAASAPPIRILQDRRPRQERGGALHASMEGPSQLATSEPLGSREDLLREVLTLRAAVERLTVEKAALEEQVALLLHQAEGLPPTPMPCSNSSAASAETVGDVESPTSVQDQQGA